MKNQHQDDIQNYSNKIFKQVENVPLLIHKYEHVKTQDIHTDDIREFLQDVKLLLSNSEN
jgi:hypothetical protein